MVSVQISAESRYPISRPQITEAVERVLNSRGVTSNVEVSVLICGTRKAAEIAKRYLRDDHPHNVLSFPYVDQASQSASQTGKNVKVFLDEFDGFLILGDIIVCYPIAQEEANEDNMLVMEKIVQLVEHGMLHLLGEHHEEE